jgi:hypothetical protein
MRSTLVALLIALVAPTLLADPQKDADREALEAEIKSMDIASIHRGVLAHEQDPLGEPAHIARPVLVAYFEDIDYIVCLDQLGFLLDKKGKVREAVFWQSVFGSGDFVLQHPDEATNKYAYMLAGLESALRAYDRILAKKPKARIDRLDNLLALRSEGRLGGYVKDHMCRDE